MTKFHWRMVAGAGFIVVAFLGLILYAVKVAPRMGRDSKAALDVFYGRCKARDYQGAHQLFSQTLQNSVDTGQLKKEWQKFEAKNGELKSWQAASTVSINGFGGSVCVFPPFVDFRHAVSGTKGTGTLIYVRMVPENGTWRVKLFNVLR